MGVEERVKADSPIYALRNKYRKCERTIANHDSISILSLIERQRQHNYRQGAFALVFSRDPAGEGKKRRKVAGLHQKQSR